MLAASLAFGIVFAGTALTLVGSQASAVIMEASATTGNGLISSTLANLAMNEHPTEAQVQSAISTVLGQMEKIELRSKEDYYNASKILIRGNRPEDALLAHELALCALALGETRAKRISAESLDHYMVRVGQSQRFGTIVQDGKPLTMDSKVTDSMRSILEVPIRRPAGSRIAVKEKTSLAVLQ